MKFYYKRRGSEVVPNKSFWLQFPLLVQVPKIILMLAIDNVKEDYYQYVHLYSRMDFYSHLDHV
jgi:hypothetical protein